MSGDIITASHKVLHEEGESRNNQWHAVVVQDLATQWIYTYPRRGKTSQETMRSSQKFLDPKASPKVIYKDQLLECGTVCEDLRWNHCTSTPHRYETNGTSENAVRRVKEGASAVLLQSRRDWEWRADSTECHCSLPNVQDLLSDLKTPYERRHGEPFSGPTVASRSLCKRSGEAPPVRQEGPLRFFYRLCFIRRGRLQKRRNYKILKLPKNVFEDSRER